MTTNNQIFFVDPHKAPADVTLQVGEYTYLCTACRFHEDKSISLFENKIWHIMRIREYQSPDVSGMKIIEVQYPEGNSTSFNYSIAELVENGTDDYLNFNYRK